MERFKLSEYISIKTIAIRMKDSERMLYFYKNVLGFVLKIEENNLSILGTQEKNSRLLILEEIEGEHEQLPSSELLSCFTLEIPTLQEFSSILRRITEHNYSINELVGTVSYLSIILEDPEKNKLEISYQGIEVEKWRQGNSFDLQGLIKQSDLLYSGLSAYVRFNRIVLNVEDESKNYHFYRQILGMSAVAETTNRVSMNDGSFEIHIDKSGKNSEGSNNLDQLGLDFFVLTIDTKKEMETLKKHLEQQQQEFYSDNKLKILTIYDPSAIEWWFVRN